MCAQSKVTIKGVVVDSTNEEELSFATVFNKSSGQATITNGEGYFELGLDSWQDSIIISYVGYKSHIVNLDSGQQQYQIGLEPSTVELDVVTVRPKDYTFLYQLLASCRSKRSKRKSTTKAYYQLRSYIEKTQIELVEAFFNAETYGYDLLDLELKCGRVGLREYENSFFGSLETSKPISRHKLFFSSDLFPESPMELNTRKMKKRYYLELETAYLDESLDSIYVLFLYPKKNKGDQFNCKVWVNSSDTTILKVELQGSNLSVFPFSPIYPEDYLSKQNLNMTKTFKSINGERVFEHIDFEYDFIYNKSDGPSFLVSTNAILFTYQDDNPFFIPYYGFKNKGLTDYQKLGVMPFNSFFWEFNNELKMNEELGLNEKFMQDTNTVTNYNFSQKQSSLNQLFSYPAYLWSPKRIAFKTLPKQTAYIANQPPYKLNGDVFLDYNAYGDSTHILTKTLFDAFNSYYWFNLNNTSNCFINLYLDIIECKRRDFIQALNYPISEDSLHSKYKTFKVELKKELKSFEEEVERGRNVENFKRWNNRVKESIKIDNLSIFGLSETE